MYKKLKHHGNIFIYISGIKNLDLFFENVTDSLGEFLFEYILLFIY